MQDSGMSVPILENIPDITGYEWVFEAFTDLTTCRSIGMGIGPIPWTAVQTYVETMGLCPYDAFFFHAMIKEMDNQFIKFTAERNRKK
jgi:hypothetical protein